MPNEYKFLEIKFFPLISEVFVPYNTTEYEVCCENFFSCLYGKYKVRILTDYHHKESANTCRFGLLEEDL